jgi:hypothetical protein
MLISGATSMTDSELNAALEGSSKVKLGIGGSSMDGLRANKYFLTVTAFAPTNYFFSFVRT